MKKYSLTCTCGHVDTVEAVSREEAVEMIKAKWTPEAIDQHMKEKHPGEPAMTKEMADAHVEAHTQEVTEVPAAPAM